MNSLNSPPISLRGALVLAGLGMLLLGFYPALASPGRGSIADRTRPSTRDSRAPRPAESASEYETVVREAYRRVEQAVADSKVPLSFQLDGFADYRDADLDRVLWSDIVTVQHGRHLRLHEDVAPSPTPGVTRYEIRPEWRETERRDPNFDPETWLIGKSVRDVLQKVSPHIPDAGEVSGLTSYRVKVESPQESRVYRAAFLWKAGESTDLLSAMIADNITEGIDRVLPLFAEAEETMSEQLYQSTAGISVAVADANPEVGAGVDVGVDVDSKDPGRPDGENDDRVQTGSTCVASGWTEIFNEGKLIDNDGGHPDGGRHEAFAQFIGFCKCDADCTVWAAVDTNTQYCTDWGDDEVNSGFPGFYHKTSDAVQNCQSFESVAGTTSCQTGYGCVVKDCFQGILCSFSVSVSRGGAGISFPVTGDPDYLLNLTSTVAECGPCPNGDPLSWSDLKSNFGGYAAASSLQAYSSINSTLIWDDSEVTQPSDYMVFRAPDTTSEPELLSIIPWGETSYVDQNIQAGNEYVYRVAVGDGTTFLDLGESNVGLKVQNQTYEPAQAAYVASHGDFLYTTLSGEIVKYDISEPGDPVELGRSSGASHPHQILVDPDGEYLYCESNKGFDVWDADDLSLVARVDDIATAIAWSAVSDIALRDDVLYVAAVVEGVQAFDVSDPWDPDHMGTYWGPAAVGDYRYYRVGFAGDHLYIRGLSNIDQTRISIIVRPRVHRIFGISTVHFDHVCSDLEPSCWTEGLALEPTERIRPDDRFTVGTMDDSTWVVLDISDPARPRPVREFSVPGYEGISEWGDPYNTIEFDGRFMYVTTFGNFSGRGLHAFDLASGAIPSPRWATGALEGQTASSFVTVRDGEVLLVDDLYIPGSGFDGRIRRIRTAIDSAVSATVTWDHQAVGGSLFSCPGGDAESLVLQIQLTGPGLDTFISASRITAYPAPDGTVSVPGGPVTANGSATNWNGHTTSVTFDTLYGCGETPFLVALDGEVVGFTLVDVRNVDATADGFVNYLDSAGLYGANGTCDGGCYDYDGSDCVDQSDIGTFSAHDGHGVPLPPVCGNGVCEGGESSNNCPVDCGTGGSCRKNCIHQQ